MPIDPYSPCPGGTGKKIKFCCSDLTSELDKIQRMLEGDQRAACLEYLQTLEAKFPDRACLLSIKATLETQLGNEAKAEETLARLIEKYPGNPVALAEKANLMAAQTGGVPAIPLLQDALEKCTEEMPQQVFDAIGVVGQMLVADNQIIAGRAHLVLQLGISGSRERMPLELLVRMNQSPQVPLVLKQDLALLPAPDDALWKQSFSEAMLPAARGAWRLAAENLTNLATAIGQWPAVMHNIAMLRLYLADTPGALSALRKLIAGPMPVDDAVEAEALAQAIDPETLDTVDVLSMTYPVQDAEAAQAKLTANPRAATMPLDLSRLGTPDEPPPKGAWFLVDRAATTSFENLKFNEIPRLVGQVFLYGKQTDRPRIELAAYRPELSAATAVLTEICGDALGTAGAAEVANSVPVLRHMLSGNWRLPAEVPAAQRRALMEEDRRDMLLNRWPAMPQRIFGGRTAAQVAGEAAQRTKLLAAILLLELSVEQMGDTFDFNELRRKLGLPDDKPIDAGAVSPSDLPLLRLGHVDPKSLSDEQIVELYRRAEHYRHLKAMRQFAEEIIARPSLDAQIEKDEVYGTLAQSEPDADKALELLDSARKAAEAARRSTAPWDLAELAMRIGQGDLEHADRLLHHIRNEHIREPGVAQALMQILVDAGIVRPDGTPVAPPREAPGIVVPGGGTAEPGKIWTPGSPEPGGAKKSALWTPDMD